MSAADQAQGVTKGLALVAEEARGGTMGSLIGINWRHLAWLGLSVALLALALACGPGEEPTPVPTATPTPPLVATPTPVPTPTPTPIGGVPKRGGSIVFTTSYPSHWDATQQCCPGGGLSVDGKLYLTMMYEEGKDKYVCDLCTKWSLEDGGKTMVFELRDDIKFHDGTPITAKDMKYTLEKATGKIGGVANQRMGYVKEYIESLEAPDTRTFKIHLKRPSPVVPGTLAITFAVIYPEGTKRADLTAPPLGPNNKYTSGPFYLKEAVRDSHILFERNPNYFKPGLPYLDGMRGQVFTDLGAQMTALLIGKADLYQTLDAGSPQFWPQLEKAVADGKMGSLSQPLWCSIGNIWLNHSNPLMQDKRIRQAINLSQDRDEFGKIRYGGRYLATTFYPADTFWGRPSDQIWNVIPGFGRGAKKEAERAQAKQLLADAGYPNGIPDVELLTGYTEGSVEAMQRGMISVGINARIQFAADTEQRWAALKYTILDRRLCLALGDPDEVMANYFLKAGPRNLMAYQNPEIERLFLLLTSETDVAKRRQINSQMVDILLDDVVAIPLTDGSQTYWMSGKLRGVYSGVTMYLIGAHRGESWWLDQ